MTMKQTINSKQLHKIFLVLNEIEPDNPQHCCGLLLAAFVEICKKCRTDDLAIEDIAALAHEIILNMKFLELH